LDLAGNVWEWCLNEYGNPDQVAQGGPGSRVLRGGSWHLYQVFVRADYRSLSLYLRPYGRYVSRGCRVLCGAPIR
jgi:formylglycine-generating enzyme required for sulfatase activity